MQQSCETNIVKRLLHGRRRFLRRLALVLLVVGLLACSISTSGPKSAPQTVNASTWIAVAPGVEYQVVRVQPLNQSAFDMHIVRFDPTLVEFRAHYRPDDPYNFLQWQAALDDSVLVFVNANFFREDYSALGLVVVDGVTYGGNLDGFGGMFQVEYDGSVRVRSLVGEPYRGEAMWQAIQSFPMLIEPGSQPSRTGAGFDDLARRSVIAQDRSGRILLMNTGLLGETSFNDLQAWLQNSSLDLDAAFALDGGKSAAMYVRGQQSIPAFSVLPTILAVYGR